MQHEQYMRRCLELARLGSGYVSPNPMVGAVLVWKNRIIGEGWHQRWGGAHAEVNCLNNVLPAYRSRISEATLYCNLEPCAHQGKTPPCADLIIRSGIPSVVIANTDPNPLVAGKGIQRMKEAGIKVETGILEQEGGWLNRSFFTWIKENRPFIILKWAQSADGFIGRPQQRLAISGPLTQRLVHRWRAASDAIMVGATTALVDNPRLDNRFYPGKSTTRIVLDAQSRLPDHFHLLDDSQETWIIGRTKPFNGKQTRCIPSKAPMSISWLLEELRLHNKAILLVEGGANLLNQFIQLHFWDEIRVIENQQKLQDGIPAPTLPDTVFLQESYFLDKDAVRIFASKHSFV